MAQIINAEARISAIDATGDTFARIASKVSGLASTMKSLGGIASSGVGAVNSTIGRLQSTMQTLAPVASGAAAYETMRGVRGAVHEAVQATAEGEHERVRMDVAGMTEAEIKEGEEVSAQLSEKYKALSQTTILHALRNMRSIVGTYEEAAQLLEPILKLRIATMGAHPERAAELNEDFDKLVKGMEIKGVTMDPAKFTAYMQGMAKAINVFGDTLRPTDYYEMFKYGRQATQNLSEEFMLKTAPTLAQELGGSSAGKAMSSFFQAIVGGRMKEAAVKELAELGLVEDDKAVRTKQGAIKGVQPGGVKGSDIAAANPYQWINQVLLPALKQHGITDPEDIQAHIATIFQQATAAQMASIFATQQSRIEKDWALVGKAKGLDAADTFGATDPFIAWSAVTEQFKNLMQVAGGPLAQPAAAGLNDIAAGISALARAAKDHPFLGAAGLAGGAAATAAAAGGAGLWATRRLVGGVLGNSAKAMTPEVIDMSGAAAIRTMQLALPQVAGVAETAVGVLGPLGMVAATTLGVIHEASKEYAGMTIPERLATHGGGTSYQAQLRRSFDEETGYNPAVTAGRWGSGAGLSIADVKAAVEGRPVVAEVKGDAELKVSVEVAPSSDFLSQVVSAVRNGINVFGGAPAIGTAGSTGRSMPEAGPAQQ